MNTDVPVWTLLLLVIVAVAEVVLAVSWNAGYWTRGLVVYSRRIQGAGSPATLPTPGGLEAGQSDSIFPAFLFRAMGHHRYAFREKLWVGRYRPAYTPMMRGLLVFETTRATVSVTGYLNWTPLAFLAVLVHLAVVLRAAWWPLIAAAVLALLYVIQAKRFGQVAADAASDWFGGQ